MSTTDSTDDSRRQPYPGVNETWAKESRAALDRTHVRLSGSYQPEPEPEPEPVTVTAERMAQHLLPGDRFFFGDDPEPWEVESVNPGDARLMTLEVSGGFCSSFAVSPNLMFRVQLRPLDELTEMIRSCELTLHALRDAVSHLDSALVKLNGTGPANLTDDAADLLAAATTEMTRTVDLLSRHCQDAADVWKAKPHPAAPAS